MDPSIDLPNVLLNVVRSVQEENFLQGWRLYCENGHTNIVLKFLPKGQPLPHSQVAKNSNSEYLRHKSPAKLVRGYHRTQEFIQSKQQEQQKDTDHTDLDLTMDNSNAKASDKIINSSELTATDEIIAHTKQTHSFSKHNDLCDDSGLSTTQNSTHQCSGSGDPFEQIINTPDEKGCDTRPDFTEKQLQRSAILDYVMARFDFHTDNHNPEALRDMAKAASSYGGRDISDPCIHFKMLKEINIT